MLIKNCRIFSTDPEEYIERGSLLIKNDRIIEIGTGCEIQATGEECEVIDAENKLCFPAMTSLYTEIHGFFQRLFPQLHSMKGVDSKILGLIGNLFYESMKNAINGMVFEYPLANPDISELDTIKQLAEKIGIHLIITVPIDFSLGREEQLKTLKLLKDTNYTFTFKNLHLLDDLYLIKLAKYLENNDKTYFLKILYSKEEAKKAESLHGLDSVGYLRQYGIFNKKSILVNPFELKEQSLDVLATDGVKIVTGIRETFRNGYTLNFIHQAMGRGITIGIGTFGLVPNVLEDMRVSYFVCLSDGYDDYSAYRFATRPAFMNNARIFSEIYFSDESNGGRIQPQMRADLLLLNYPINFPFSREYIAENTVFALDRYCTVDTLITSGKIFMKDGKSIMMDEKDIMTSFENAVNLILEKR